jgi:polyisoprenoid-binding protein YceI
MNMTLRANFSRCTDALLDPGANALRSISVAASAFVLSGVAVATTSAAESSGRPGHCCGSSWRSCNIPLELDEIPPGTYDITTKETLVRYGVDHMGFSEYWGTFPGATRNPCVRP